MRDVRAALTAAWRSGTFIGDQRPIARVTAQQGRISLYDSGNNLYATLPFGATKPPKELPNVKKVSWNRSVDAEVASCTIELYNTAPLPLGSVGYPDLDQPGYFTFQHGQHTFSQRWGHKPNEWSTILVPDNVLRTYEGYGFNPDACPEDDEHLEQTGVWMIDSVSYQAGGIIQVQCRDIGRVLSDQIVFPPVVPKDFYPLSFTRSTTQPGFVPGYTETKTVTPGGDFDRNNPPPAGWRGPLSGPRISNVIDASGKVTVTLKPPLPNWNNAPATPDAGLQLFDPGYEIVGYQAVVDNVTLPTIYRFPYSAKLTAALAAELVAFQAEARTKPGSKEREAAFAKRRPLIKARAEAYREYMETSKTFKICGLSNGVSYLVNFVAVYRATGATGVKDAGRRVTGNRSNDLFARPHGGTSGKVAPDISSGSVRLNADADGNTDVGETHPGMISFGYAPTEAPVEWTVIFYRTENRKLVQHVEHFSEPAASAPISTDGGVDLPTTSVQTSRRDLTSWNIQLYGTSNGVQGRGEAVFRSVGGPGEFYRPPVAGSPPQSTPSPTTPTVTLPNGQTSVLGGAITRLKFDGSSNAFYVGHSPVFGHEPEHAFDGRQDTYFLSVGNISPAAGFAYEWVQGSMTGRTVVGVRFTTVKKNYTAYISVFAGGRWISFNPGDVIRYNPNLPPSHNGANIPFAAKVNVPSEAEVRVTFKRPIPGATKIRITLNNLQDFNVGRYEFRGAVRELVAVTQAPGAGGGRERPIVDVSPDVNPVTYTKDHPPRVEVGAGATPGKYFDYTDLVKLFCAWGGFHWPNNAHMLKCDGTKVAYDFGPGPYGLPKMIDPVLGEDDGRVWGDFENTGTGGVADLTSDTWDKKSLLDAIIYVREIIGFLFFIDETGGAVWRTPNIWTVGNDVATLTKQPRRVSDMLVLDEASNLLDLSVQLSSRNVRERIFITNTDGTAAALAQGYNPNPIGLRRVGGWTDQNFKDNREATRMADRIAIRQLMTYRENTVVIAGYPALQVNDQVQIYERVANEGWVHYVNSISSDNDMETGEWTYSLTTTWLGSEPGATWIFHPDDLSDELKDWLDEVGLTPKPTTPAVPPATGGTKMQIFIQVQGNPAQFITDGITRRHVTNQAERTRLIAMGLAANKTQFVTQAIMDQIPRVG